MLAAINNFLNADSKAESPELNEDAFGAFSIDEYRPMRIAVVGAGASGILAGIRSVAQHKICGVLVDNYHRFRQHVPNAQLTIYEQMDGIGGTWYANKYP